MLLHRLPGQSIARHFSTDIPKKRFSLSNGLARLLLRSQLTDDADIARFLGKTTSYTLYGLFGMTALGTLGVDTSPLLAGIGVTGFTLGFALKEIATNLLAGVLLVVAKPFRSGQYLRVMVGGGETKLEGQVMQFSARHVHLRTKAAGIGINEEGVLLVPSSLVYTNPIIVSDSKS